MFSRQYPDGDRGGNEVCVRVSADGPAINLHALWDRLITSSKKVGRLGKLAMELRKKFPKGWVNGTCQQEVGDVGQGELRHCSGKRLSERQTARNSEGPAPGLP
jgi:hypothetical protein